MASSSWSCPPTSCGTSPHNTVVIRGGVLLAKVLARNATLIIIMNVIIFFLQMIFLRSFSRVLTCVCVQAKDVETLMMLSRAWRQRDDAADDVTAAAAAADDRVNGQEGVWSSLVVWLVRPFVRLPSSLPAPWLRSAAENLEAWPGWSRCSSHCRLVQSLTLPAVCVESLLVSK